MPEIRFYGLIDHLVRGLHRLALQHGGLGHHLGDIAGDLVNIRQIRQQGALLPFHQRRALRQRTAGRHKHGIGHPGGAGGDDAKADPREDEGVVALGDDVALALVLHRSKRAAGGHQRLTIGPADEICRRCLDPGGGVGEREDDGTGTVLVHGLDHLFGEQTRLAGDPDQNVRATVLHYLQQGDVVPHRPVGNALHRLGEAALEIELVGDLVGDKTESVHHKDPATRLGIGQPFGLHLRHDLLGDAAAGAACAEESDSLLGELGTGGLAGGDQAAQRHRRSALNVVVEAAELVLVAIEQRHGVVLGEILKLQQDIGPAALDRLNEGIDELGILFTGDARIAPAHVEGVVQQLLVVGAHIQHHRQAVGGRDAATGGVKRQLADGNAHAADALVTQTQNPLTVGDHDHLDVLLGGVLQHVIDPLLVRIGDEEATGAAIDVGELLARLAHRRGVDDGQHLGQVVVQQPIEQCLVGVLDVAQIDVLVHVVAKRHKLAIGTLGLLLDGLDILGQQPLEVEVAALFAGEGAPLVEQRGLQQSGAGVGNVERTFLVIIFKHGSGT